MSPDACEAIGLELDRDRYRFGLRLRLIQLSRAPLDARELLDVMPHFVRNHVRAREIPRRAEAVAQFLEKPRSR